MRALPSQHAKYFIRCQWAERIQQGLPLFVRLGSDSQLNVRLLLEESADQELPCRAGPLARVYSFRSPPENLIPALHDQAELPVLLQQNLCLKGGFGMCSVTETPCLWWPVPCAQPSWQKGAGNLALDSTQSPVGTCLESQGLPRSNKSSTLCQIMSN